MDFNLISQFITGVGFPIAACVFMGLYIKQKDDSHKQEMDKLSEAINNNTIVIQKLVDKFDNMEEN